MEKSNLRKLFKSKRLVLSQKQVDSYSKLIAQNFSKNLLPKITNFSQKKIAFYLPANNEVNPSFILNEVSKTNLIALPRIALDTKVLEFRKYLIGDKLERNSLYKNLFEPQKTSEYLVPDLVFTPLLAFDYNCNRLGMGGGFYDSTISFFRSRGVPVIFIGLAYQIQQYKKIPVDDNDQALDFIVSDNEIFSSQQLYRLLP